MDPNRTFLLAQNGMPGEYIVSQPSGSIVRSPLREACPKTETTDRRESVDSLDSIVREKEEAQTQQPSRSGVRAFISKAAKRLSGPSRAQGLIERSEERGEESVGSQRPFEVAGKEKEREQCQGERAKVPIETIEKVERENDYQMPRMPKDNEGY